MTSKCKIVAPINLSRPTEEHVRYALCVAAALRADLHLLYVVNGESSRDFANSWPSNAEASNINVHRVVLHGTAAATIAEYADSIDADLILMASRRYGTWKRLWRKSVTEAVMTLSRLPVLIASTTATDGDFRFRNSRLLCVAGLDSSRDTALVQHAAWIAATTDSDVVLLHVVPEPSEALLYHAADGGSRPLSSKRAAIDVADLTRMLTVPPTRSVMVGDADKCIGLAALEHSVDLVLVSRASGRLQAAYGHNLPNIVGRLRCPLLTVPVDARASVQPINDDLASLYAPKVVNTGVSSLRRRFEGDRHVTEGSVVTVHSRS